MERRNSGRIRSKALSSFHVYLDSDNQVEGQLIDISETGLQFAVTTTIETEAIVKSASYTGFLIGSLIDDEVHFDAKILWQRKESNSWLVGIEFFEPMELPSTMLALKMSEAE